LQHPSSGAAVDGRTRNREQSSSQRSAVGRCCVSVVLSDSVGPASSHARSAVETAVKRVRSRTFGVALTVHRAQRSGRPAHAIVALVSRGATGTAAWPRMRRRGGRVQPAPVGGLLVGGRASDAWSADPRDRGEPAQRTTHSSTSQPPALLASFPATSSVANTDARARDSGVGSSAWTLSSCC
jgi:hypothetical protein